MATRGNWYSSYFIAKRAREVQELKDSFLKEGETPAFSNNQRASTRMLLMTHEFLSEHRALLDAKDESTVPKIHLAIVDSRHYTNYDAFSESVLNWCEEHDFPAKIISGGASGADTMAEKFAKEQTLPFEVYRADWKKHGKAAGPMRNAQIVSHATHVLAFVAKDSIGTKDTVAKARATGKHVTEVDI